MTTKAIAEKKDMPVGAPRGTGRGIENMEKEDLLIPRILLMQGLSKLVTREGKKAGTFVNSVTKEDLGKDFEFIPVVMTKYFDVLREEGDKMVFDYRVFDKNDSRLRGKRMFNDGDLKANCNAVLSIISIVDGEPAIISFSKTSYKAGKKLLTMMKMAGGDAFDNSYKLIAKSETRADNDYYVLEVEPGSKTSDADYKLAEKIYDSFGKRVADIHTNVPADEDGGTKAATPPPQREETPPPSEPPAKEVQGELEDSTPAETKEPEKPTFTKVRVLMDVRGDNDRKCKKCGELRDLREGKVKSIDPETNLPWGRVRALVCKKCNLLDVVEKLPDVQ